MSDVKEALTHDIEFSYSHSKQLRDWTRCSDGKLVPRRERFWYTINYKKSFARCYESQIVSNVENKDDSSNIDSWNATINEKGIFGRVEECEIEEEDHVDADPTKPEAIKPESVRPKASRPKAVASKAVRPKTVAPKAVAPKAERPKPVRPKTVGSKAVASKAVRPKAVRPKMVASKAVAPKAVAPKVVKIGRAHV